MPSKLKIHSILKFICNIFYHWKRKHLFSKVFRYFLLRNNLSRNLRVTGVLKKQETSFITICWYDVENIKVNFSSSFEEVTNSFLLKSPRKKIKKANFLYIRQIKKWDYELQCKYMWCWKFFCHFFGRKIMIWIRVICVFKQRVSTNKFNSAREK